MPELTKYELAEIASLKVLFTIDQVRTKIATHYEALEEARAQLRQAQDSITTHERQLRLLEATEVSIEQDEAS